MKRVIKFVSDNILVFIFLISGTSTFGSLYFSEVQGLVPCLLCWYQRIFMYPIFLLTAVSLATKQQLSKKFLFALSLPGTLIAAYHYYIQKFPAENQFVPCTGGVDCSATDFQALGFITIPFLSLVAFAGITFLILLNYFIQRRAIKK